MTTKPTMVIAFGSSPEMAAKAQMLESMSSDLDRLERQAG